MTQQLKYNMIDLFAGAGGLSTGFAQTGRFNIIAAVESALDMKATYSYNHKKVDMYSDILSIDFNKLKDKYNQIDVVVGGPPCQGFSNANRQQKAIVNKNNQLTKAYIDAIMVLTPKVFVLENVSMLRSSKHLFICSNKDYNFINTLGIKMHERVILTKRLNFDIDYIRGVIDDKFNLTNFIMSDYTYVSFKALYKLRNDINAQLSYIENNKDNIVNNLKEYLGVLEEKEEKIFLSVKHDTESLYNSIISNNLDLILLNNYIEVQQTLRKLEELIKSDIYVKDIIFDGNYIKLIVEGYTVLDYIISRVEGIYSVKSGILNAADFGAPQNRKRFILIGTRKDYTNLNYLPVPILHKNNYNTVGMAIRDLENEQPVSDLDKYTFRVKNIVECSNNRLLQYLNDTNILYNHINTKSRDKTIEKFKQLKPGDNFHNLSAKYKIDYSNPSRTQNSIYKRLNYKDISGTVVNVRKSMWIHPAKDRAISIREAARLQTFPDSYVFIGTKDSQYQQVGNAVPPILARSIAEAVLKSMGEKPVKFLRDVLF